MKSIKKRAMTRMLNDENFLMLKNQTHRACWGQVITNKIVNEQRTQGQLGCCDTSNDNVLLESLILQMLLF